MDRGTGKSRSRGRGRGRGKIENKRKGTGRMRIRRRVKNLRNRDWACYNVSKCHRVQKLNWPFRIFEKVTQRRNRKKIKST